MISGSVGGAAYCISGCTKVFGGGRDGANVLEGERGPGLVDLVRLLCRSCRLLTGSGGFSFVRKRDDC